MKQATDTDETLRNTTKNHKIKILTVNVNGFNNSNKRTKIFNILKTNKIDITSTRNTFYEYNRKTMVTRLAWNYLLERSTHTSICPTSNSF